MQPRALQHSETYTHGPPQTLPYGYRCEASGAFRGSMTRPEGVRLHWMGMIEGHARLRSTREHRFEL